jgi:hypothetical protein
MFVLSNVSLGSIGEYEGHFTWRLKYVFFCISSSICGNFQIRYNLPYKCMRYKQNKFGCNRSIIKGPLLE